MKSSFRRLVSGTTLALTIAVGMPAASAADAPVHVSATLRANASGPTVNPAVFGQFAEDLGHSIYGGVWVGPKSKIPNTDGYRTDVLHALQALKVPVVRWPGGCFADRYDWRDGVGPADKRPMTENVSWGGVDDDNSFGTPEYMKFMQLIGARTFVAGNVGSEPPSLLAHWVDYMTSTSHSKWAQMRRRDGRDKPWRLNYLGVGNELWGCGGNMTADYAADLLRRYVTFVHVDGPQHTDIIGPGANGDDYAWIDTLMKKAGRFMNGIGLHYYVIPGGWSHMQPASQFDEAGWIDTLSKALYMNTLVSKDSAIMDKYDPKKRVSLVVDEWGTWFKAEQGTNPAFLYQQNTLRDGMVAALTLNIFVHHADRVRMANIAQMVNVLQAMILTKGDKMILTPTYYVFKMFIPYQGAEALPLKLDTPAYTLGKVSVPAVQGSAVRGKDGKVHMVLVNLDPHKAAQVAVRLEGMSAHGVSGQILTGPQMNTHNTFAHPDTIKPEAFDGAHVRGASLEAKLPAKSIVVLDVD
ncbi:alpha-N-arabinofuranosidase [Dyella sp. A6]|uniref:alpha-N-arabinofuranosidase n=1 Tax=Dyella aluminiiresistens TaxID=3069105 RepID=UPI002E76CEF5|nr:alpha-L-arabinofuranosidase C-terminal domain-containing protein [Dyella sp. A6]